MELYAVKSSMKNTARQIEHSTFDFKTAITEYQNATANLLDCWAGDAQMRFNQEYEEYKEMLNVMAEGIKLYYQAIDKAVAEYTKTDEMCVAILRRV